MSRTFLGAVLLMTLSAMSAAQPTITVRQYALLDENQRWRITRGSDGALWFTDGVYDRIGRITTSGAITLYRLADTGSYPYAITTGPDGALWFTMANAERIGRITTDGLISEYPLPTAGPQGGNIWSEITTGPDGAIWLTRWSHGIDRVTTTGAVSEILFRTDPTNIITGPDGALWFSDAEGAIGRIGTDGTRTSFPLPSEYLHSITVGPDGAFWFTADRPGAERAGSPIIGRLTLTGALTTFDLSSQVVFANRIVAGPDGALWFTVFSGPTIGRISTDGVVTLYSVPGGGPNGFNDIVLGPDRALWLVGGGAGIVHVTVEQIDTTKPVSQVSALPASEPSPAFTLGWSGTDTGSGIRDYSIYVSDSCGPFTAWMIDTIATQAVFSGVAGHTYRFYSIARDLAGNVENAKTAPDATTTVSVGTAPSVLSITNYCLIGQQVAGGGKSNVTYQADLVNAGSPLGSVVARLDTLDPFAVRVIPGQETLNFGPVPANSQNPSRNTFTVLVDPTVPIDFSKLQWRFETSAAAPVANAGPNQTVGLGSVVTLDGSASTNPSGVGTLTYYWTFKSRPPGTATRLFYANIASPAFVADAPGMYVITLTVSNGVGSSSADVIVTVP